MKAVIQRVSQAQVKVDEKIIGQIKQGLVILLGLGKDDTEIDILPLVEKIINLRIFEDENGKMNLSLLEIKGEVLVVSQFTLYGSCRKGRRPSFDQTLPPGKAKILYQQFITALQARKIPVATGLFQAKMQLEIFNQGPVTFILETKQGKIL
jgi:D-tyrosyl-tRNA(Tyr) deacylase